MPDSLLRASAPAAGHGAPGNAPPDLLIPRAHPRASAGVGSHPAGARGPTPLPDPVLAREELGLSCRPLVVDPRRVPSYRFDLVVVGSGVAGAAAALAAAEQGLQVAVLAKADLSETNTRYAQGGLAAVLSPEDSFRSHVADTLEAGMGLCEPEVVDYVVRGGPGAVERLLSAGARFDLGRNGDIELSREGGHSHPRVAHANGDATGLEIQRCLSAALAAHERITVFPHTFAVELSARPAALVDGVLAQTARGDLVAFEAPDVVLATGGSGHVYRETTNPIQATGDGVALAFRAGARVRDLEFYQFHPTCLYIAGAARVLISEIVRGAGGVLRDRHGVRFMPDLHPAAELAPRDVVSRCVFQRMVETNDTNVYLDLSGIPGDPHALFPGISRICRAFRIDIARDAIPVRPGAHYQVGGVEVDGEGRTSVSGLWAAGECSSSGLHGANRLGSNSLLEGLVLGERAGRAVAEHRSRRAGGAHAGQAAWRAPVPAPSRGTAQVEASLNLEDLTYSLKSMMWRHMGVLRGAEGLEEMRGKLAFWSRVVQDLAPAEPRAWELLDMLLVARLAALAAHTREESRGVHARTDHPHTRTEWAVHSVLQPRIEGARLVEVSLFPQAVQAAALSPR